jgi:hypothetical protein
MSGRLVPLAAALLLIGTLAHAEDSPPPATIGTATMDDNGTITLDLFGDKNANYALGHLQYKRGDKEYEAVLLHIGGIKPGEYKPVPPWPEDTH